MAINFADIRNYIYQWAIANIPSGMPAIYLYNNSPRPTVDYITLLIANVVQVGWDWEQGPLSTAGVSEQVGDREFLLTVQGYGGDPLTVLNNLRTSLQKQTVLDTLRANGIVFANWSDAQDITDLVDSRYEQRATMDITFRIADVYSDLSGMIETVVLQEVFKNSVGDTVYDETFTIPT